MNLCMKMGMGAALAAAMPLGGDPTLWCQWGLAGLVVAYTLWRDHHRERHLSKVIEKEQLWIRQTLIEALERNSVALERLARSGEPK